MKIRIATRGSDLALAQATYVQKRLGELSNPPETEIQIIKTSGDRIQDVPLSSINTGDSTDDRKGFFTKEIEDALLAHDADIAVHSFKDLPTLDVPGLKIVSMPQRLTPNDIILFPKQKRQSEAPPYIAPGSVIGTSSVRRISQIQYRWPDIRTRDLRGNVPTRIRKLLEGEYDAILLSGAGFDRLMEEGTFERLGLKEQIDRQLEAIRIPPEEFVPAPAQGALALQCREDDAPVREVLVRLQDHDVAKEVDVERAVLKAVEGGCHLPLGTYCKKDHQNNYQLFIYLGKEAQDNRKKISYDRIRVSRDPELLKKWAIAEIKEQLPVILTGRPERLNQLRLQFPERNLHTLPLIKTSPLDLSEHQAQDLKERLSQPGHPDGIQTIAVFSEPGVIHIHRVLSELGADTHRIHWAVVGDRTEDVLLEFYPGANVFFKSPDGTGKGLGRLIALEKERISGPVLMGVAKENRPEFEQELAHAGVDAIRLELYETSSYSLEQSQVDALPDQAYVLLGSPSAAKTFFAELNHVFQGQFDSKTRGYRYCAIGPTTEEAIQSLGYEVYARCREPDYVRMIEEFS